MGEIFAKTICDKTKEIEGLIYYLSVKYSFKLSNSEIETLSKYLAYYNYCYFDEVLVYQNQFVLKIHNSKDNLAYISYNYLDTSISLIEENALTNFTEKERIDYIFTSQGKMIFQTIDDFNLIAFFNYETSKNININEYREIEIPQNIEPDAIISLNSTDDFDKLVTLKIKIELLKLNYNSKERNDMHVKI